MILDDIVRDNTAELVLKRQNLPLAEVRKLALAQPVPRDFAAVLRADGLGLIAEVKQASPSAGVIKKDFDPAAIALTYAANGANALSVLTEPRYFKGSLAHLRLVRQTLGEAGPPLLRKDFITDAYQIYEARAFGADAVLLIVAILTPQRLGELLAVTRELGLAALVEAHDAPQAETAVVAGAEIIGINNRDLLTFKVDLAVTGKLRPLVPPERVLVSESGIRTREDIKWLEGLGVNAVLIGETLMRAPDIGAKIRELL